MPGINQAVARLAFLPKSLFFWLAYFASLFAALLLVQFVPHGWFWYAWGIAGCISAWYITLWFVRTEGLTLAQIGLAYDRFTIARFFVGIVAGLCLITMIFVLVLHFGHLHSEPNHAASLPLVLFWSAALIPNALHEELGFRSYTLHRLQARFGMWTAQLVIAFVFALYHFIGGMNLITVLLSAALWSVIYSMATVLSRGIAFAVGLHAGGNIGQAVLGTKPGFPALWSVVPDSGSTSTHLQTIVLSTQAVVLLSAIAIMGVLSIRCRRSR